MDSTAENKSLLKEEEDFFNIIESAIDLSKYIPHEVDFIKTDEDGNNSRSTPLCRSARMNLSIFRELQSPEIVNPTIPTLVVKRKRDIENRDPTNLFMVSKQTKKQ